MNHRWMVPEIVQTSAMDCGPAALKCLLEGFGISASYGRLREACQTEVDGTSIDTIEEVAVQLGLQAEQVMLPVDHLLLSETEVLPALVVVTLPNGLTHFVVAWSCYGGFVQVMDPAVGRRWISNHDFMKEVYVHSIPVGAEEWRQWAGSSSFLKALLRRMKYLGLRSCDISRNIDIAVSDPGWRSLAALDAAARAVRSLNLSRASGSRESTILLEAIFQKGREEKNLQEISDAYWSVRPAPADDSEKLIMRGAVLVQIQGRRNDDKCAAQESAGSRQLPPELANALQETPIRPGRELLNFLFRDGWFVPSFIVFALLLASSGFFAETLLFRAMLEIGPDLSIAGQRLAGLVAVVALLSFLLLLDLSIFSMVLRLGRRLEARLRISFLNKIPRLVDRYFHSRLTSDMAERSHTIHSVRYLPDLAAQLLRSLLEISITTAVIIWLDPSSALIAVAATLSAIIFPLAAQPFITQRDLRVRNHAAALSRFYLDAFLGLVALRTHGAEKAHRREHESLLVEWARAGSGLQRVVVAFEAIQFFAGFGLAAWLVMSYLTRATNEPGSMLLLVYLALNIPFLSQEIAIIAWQYPAERNRILRLLEPLGAAEEIENVLQHPYISSSSGIKITMEGVSVKTGGQTVLSDIQLEVESGTHVAIVGPSGAGKSTLVGVLLGWHKPTAGKVRIDDVPLDALGLENLRSQTSWIDPSVHIWNLSLMENLNYGNNSNGFLKMGRTLELAELNGVIQLLKDGLQTPLGEGGALVSGGEGQRVRFGRALLRSASRLVILDEPFSGLDRDHRQELLVRARSVWQNSTLLCITHDISETLTFDRVLVVENGQIVEDDHPKVLCNQPSSRYRALLDSEESIRQSWSEGMWRSLWLKQGRLIENSRREELIN